MVKAVTMRDVLFVGRQYFTKGLRYYVREDLKLYYGVLKDKLLHGRSRESFMRNVLVTGVNGFIGGVLARELMEEGVVNVVGLGFDKHKRAKVETSSMVYGDLRDPSFCRRVVGDYEINQIYHLAAQSIVRICANDPVTAYSINVMGTVNLLEACRTVGKNTVDSVVVSTSDKAYGHAPVPYTEKTPLMPKFTYEATKTCQDIVARNYFYNYDVPVKVARFSNVYGPGDSNLSRLIPRTITRLYENKPPVLYGGVAGFVRELVYIDDAVSAFRLLGDKGIPGEAYCVGGTGKHRILDVVNMLIEEMGSSLKAEIVDKPSNFKEIQEQYIDASKIKALGWSPKTALVEGLKNSISYYTSLKG